MSKLTDGEIDKYAAPPTFHPDMVTWLRTFARKIEKEARKQALVEAAYWLNSETGGELSGWAAEIMAMTEEER